MPVRVLMVAPSLDILGGQAVQAARLCAHLQKEHTVEVDFLPVNPRLPGALHLLQKVKYLRTLVTSALYGATLLARVRRYDVIHIFSASYYSFVLAPTPALLISRLYGKKTILNYHSGEAADHLARWRRTAIPTIRLASRVAVPSGYLVKVFEDFGLPAQPIFNIVESDRFQFRLRRPLQPVFLSNRNLEPLYDVGCILRAFSAIQRRFPSAVLLVAGDGSQRVPLERLCRHLLLRNVEFLGKVPPEDMPRLYDRADIYLNSSRIDNMPISLMEAFACGLPVVTTDAGGIPYIVQHCRTGFLAPCGDDQVMAGYAMQLLEDPELATRVAFAARQSCEQYTWSAVRDQWLQLYQELGTKARAG
jgi:L-malate glycosyltransferase